MTDDTARIAALELLPCPWCGGIPFRRGPEWGAYFECDRCGAAANRQPQTIAKAATIWNTRADALPAPSPSKVAALVEAALARYRAGKTFDGFEPTVTAFNDAEVALDKACADMIALKDHQE